MPVLKHNGCEAAFHLRDLVFERLDSRVDLARVRVALLAPLEHRGQIARVVIAISNVRMHRLVQRAVLDRIATIRMDDRGGEARHEASEFVGSAAMLRDGVPANQPQTADATISLSGVGSAPASNERIALQQRLEFRRRNRSAEDESLHFAAALGSAGISSASAFRHLRRSGRA